MESTRRPWWCNRVSLRPADKEALEHLRHLSPSSIDLEIQLLGLVDGDLNASGEGHLEDFLNFLITVTQEQSDFELVQAVTHRFLMVSPAHCSGHNAKATVIRRLTFE